MEGSGYYFKKKSNSNNNSYKIKFKKKGASQDEQLGCPFLKIRTGTKLWIGRLTETSKRTSTSNSLIRGYTGVISFLITQKLFFYVIKVIFSVYKDSKIKYKTF